MGIVTVRRFSFAVLVTLMAARGAAGVDAQPAPKVTVVAAENFYGDIARQIGGDRVSVTSLLSEANADPREFAPDRADLAAVAGADVVIENGAGYDPWMDALLSASPRASRIVLVCYSVAPDRMPENGYIWYGVDNAGSAADALMAALSKLRPDDAALFWKNNQDFHRSLVDIKRMFAIISARWGGAPVGLTENLFLYQTRPLGLRVLTPAEYQKAVGEGTDPPAEAAAEAENQIMDHRIRLLIANGQNASTASQKVQDEARQAGIPVVEVTETMPAGDSYQSWMLKQLDEIQAALRHRTR